MQRKAFKMFLLPGFEQEYEKRHDEIWPELADLLKQVGIQNYSIFLDAPTLTLFAYLEAPDLSLLDTLPAQELMKNGGPLWGISCKQMLITRLFLWTFLPYFI